MKDSGLCLNALSVSFLIAPTQNSPCVAGGDEQGHPGNVAVYGVCV